jgi:HPt (histidine-containing phosphotransfer) domain-containing protein
MSSAFRWEPVKSKARKTVLAAKFRRDMQLRNVFIDQTVSVNPSEWAMPETLREFADGGDTELVVDLIRVFKDDTAVRLRDLRKAADVGDVVGLKLQAHTIKGSARQMGASTLAEVCKQLEQASLDTPVSELIIYADNAEVEFTKAWRAMSSYSLPGT